MKATFKLQSIFKQCSPQFDTYMHIYDHVVKPILLYGSDIWGIDQIMKNGTLNFNLILKDNIERNHINFCRHLLGVNKKAPNIGILGETGRYPISVEAICNSIKYFIRILNSEDDSLLNKAYNECLKINDESSWLVRIQQILKIIGVSIQRDSNTAYVIKIIKNFLLNRFIEFWRNELFNDNHRENGNKLRSYRSYKYQFKKEEYLSMSKDQRCCFSKLRLSAHKLHIEPGRYVYKKDRLEPSRRTCKFCQKNVCEDEFHFAMDCAFSIKS